MLASVIIDLYLCSSVLVLYGTLSIIVCFYLSFSNYLTYISNYSFYVCFCVFMFVLYFVYSVFFYFLCRFTVSPFVYSCLFSICVEVYADDVNILGGSIRATKENAEA